MSGTEDTLARMADLESLLQRLDEERADIDHRGRRLGDGLERAGGHDPLLTPDLDGLDEQRKANAAARDKAMAELSELQKRLDETQG